MSFKRFTLFAAILALAGCLLASSPLFAQSTTTGEIAGTVTDPSGAVLPNVTVTLKSVDKGYNQTAKTNTNGSYRFPLLAPGSFSVSATSAGFKTTTESTTVAVGSTSPVNIKLEVGTAGTTVEVTGEAPLLQTDSSEISTTMNTLAVQSLPNPGNDLSFIAQTAPGSVMNTGSGYGNFSSYGISATSNLFTVNGMYDNDPFLNLNNSGATNLLLGNNEIQEATVVSNGYSGQYGGFAGAQVNYVTKSGSNQWHGNAAYWWDGRVMNANNFFNVGNNTPRPFVNANQYAASFGGPIKKDKAFFFWNYEGLRVIIPTSSQVIVPTTQFETATIDNLNAIGLGQSVPFYNTMFGLYNNAEGVSRAVPGVSTAADTSGCDGATYTDATTGLNFGGGGLPCARSYRGSAPNFTHEYLTSGRFDFNVTNSDNIFIRLQEDKGIQATFTDQINPLFNAVSNQPEYQGQVSWNRTFGVKAANNVVFSAQYYSAIFSNSNLNSTLAAFPTTVLINDGALTPLGGEDYVWPQGRKVTGYQVVDDYSYALNSKHTLKAGLYYHRNLVADHDYGLFTSGLDLPITLDDFYYGGFGTGATGGGATLLAQNFATSLNQPIKLYQLGLYAQDEWRVSPSLKLTFALRADHNSNPICGTNCFANFSSSFESLDHNVNVPYNQAVTTGLSRALPKFTNIAWQPRFGFSWSPLGLKNTVLRGGIGLFMDTFPGQIADTLSSNIPLVNPFQFTIFGNLAPGQVAAGGLAGAPGNVFSTAAASNAALLTGFSGGQTLAQLQAATGGAFTPPAFGSAGNIKAPQYQEWNLEIQQAIGTSTSINLNYVGNHGIHETALFNGVNGFCPASTCPNGFPGLPAVQPDQRFGTVTDVRTAAVSNYNGLSASVQHRFNHGLQLQFNYTWSHALDEISNGGFNPFISNNSSIGRVGSLLFPENNNNLREFNYGNADYDTRHYVSMSYVYELPHGPTQFLKGWQVSGTLFARSGLPYTVIDGTAASGLAGDSFGGTVYATFAGSAVPGCTSPTNVNAGPCLNPSLFPGATNPGVELATGDINQRRNQFFGPRYFDTDFTVMKYTNIPHWEQGKLGLGVQFFNIFNHPNFQSPVNDVSASTFGHVLDTVNTPTSILGSFLGGDASPRLIQLTAKFNF